jgi:hypothetical protein
MTARSMPGAAIRRRPDGRRGSRIGSATALGDLTWPEAAAM